MICPLYLECFNFFKFITSNFMSLILKSHLESLKICSICCVLITLSVVNDFSMISIWISFLPIWPSPRLILSISLHNLLSVTQQARMTITIFANFWLRNDQICTIYAINIFIKATGTGQKGQMHPRPSDFSIAKVALFDFTSRGKFLPNEYIDRVVAVLRCWIHSSLFVSWRHSYCLFYITDYCKHIKHVFNQSVEFYYHKYTERM